MFIEEVKLMELNNHVLQEYLRKIKTTSFVGVLVASAFVTAMSSNKTNSALEWLKELQAEAQQEQISGQENIITKNDPFLLRTDLMVPAQNKRVFLGCTFKPEQTLLVKAYGYASLVNCEGAFKNIILENQSTLDITGPIIWTIEGITRQPTSKIIVNGIQS